MSYRLAPNRNSRHCKTKIYDMLEALSWTKPPWIQSSNRWYGNLQLPYGNPQPTCTSIWASHYSGKPQREAEMEALAAEKVHPPDGAEGEVATTMTTMIAKTINLRFKPTNAHILPHPASPSINVRSGTLSLT